jgi:hypothetical protein
MAAEIFCFISSKMTNICFHFYRSREHYFTQQNLLFYYDSEAITRPAGMIFLEGCYCERLVSAPSCIAQGTPQHQSANNNNNPKREEKLQVGKENYFIFANSPRKHIKI